MVLFYNYVKGMVLSQFLSGNPLPQFKWYFPKCATGMVLSQFRKWYFLNYASGMDSLNIASGTFLIALKEWYSLDSSNGIFLHVPAGWHSLDCSNGVLSEFRKWYTFLTAHFITFSVRLLDPREQ